MAGRSGGGGRSAGGGSRGGGGMSRGSSGRSMGSRGSSGRSLGSSGSNRSGSSMGGSSGFGGSRSGGGSRPSGNPRPSGGYGGGFGGPGLGGGFGGGPRPHRNRRSSNAGSFLGGYMMGRSSNHGGIPPYDGPNNMPGRRNRRGSSGCGTVLLVIIVFLFLLFMFSSIGSKTNTASSSSKSTNGVTSNTVKREPLSKGLVKETEYYEDKLDWISNKTTLTKGLKNFYNLTGIQPYILLTPSIGNNPDDSAIDDYANHYYDEHFTDEAHLLFLYIEDIDYMYGIVGSSGLTIIDQEAWDIIFDYVEKYWKTDMEEDELFSKSFDEAGQRIMSDPNAGTQMKTSVVKVFIIVIAVIIILVIIRKMSKDKATQKRQEAQDLKDMLNKPLDSFGNSDIDDLKDKYDK